MIHTLLLFASTLYSTGQCDDLLGKWSSYGKQGDSTGKHYDVQVNTKTGIT